jgi:hypothetical protein
MTNEQKNGKESNNHGCQFLCGRMATGIIKPTEKNRTILM